MKSETLIKIERDTISASLEYFDVIKSFNHTQDLEGLLNIITFLTDYGYQMSELRKAIIHSFDMGVKFKLSNPLREMIIQNTMEKYK